MANDTDESEPQRIEINRDVDTEIHAAAYRRLAGADGPRFYLTLTFDAIAYRRLAGLLGANLKGRATVHFLDIQAPLDDDEEDDEPAASPQRTLPGVEVVETRMTVNGEDNQRVLTRRRRNGTTAEHSPQPHRFVENEFTPGLCGNCHMREDDELHDVAPWSLEMPRMHVYRPGPEGRCRWCYLSPDATIHGLPDDEPVSPLATRLLQDLADDASRVEPATEDEARQQAEAMSALAHRSAGS
jgi:hypothetical protein